VAWKTWKRPGGKARRESDKSCSSTSSVAKIMAKSEFLRAVGVRLRHFQINHTMYSRTSAVVEPMVRKSGHSILTT